jgi:hypothetical protein
MEPQPERAGRGQTPSAGASRSEPSGDGDGARARSRTPFRLGSWRGRPRLPAARLRLPWRRAEIHDPALALAREWIVARGGRLVCATPQLVDGRLPDAARERYTISASTAKASTASADHARQEHAAALLAPGAPDLQALIRAVTRQAAGLALRLLASRASPEALARLAFAPPAAGCDGCSHAGGDGPAYPVCAACPLLDGRFVVLGLGARTAVHATVAAPRHEDRSVEYTFTVSVGTPLGRRDELVRFAVDATTGERLAPLPETLLRRIGAAPEDAPHPAADGSLARQLLAQAEAHLESAARAAARLVRMQALPEYRRRQEEIETLYAQQLLEAPERAAALLPARERALGQLAESLAVDLDVRLVHVATVLSPVARMRVQFAKAGDITVDVDVGRGTVAPPRCAACGAAWRVGAQCANGHITCVACHQQCAHCGARRCARCETGSLSPCPICAAHSCDRCARSAERTHRRLQATGMRAWASRELVPAPDGRRHGSTPGGAPTTHAAPGGPAPRSEDLTLADLDAMSPATWRACVRWLLANLGYELEQELSLGSDDGDVIALVCRRVNHPPAPLPLELLPSAPLVVATALRPPRAAALGEGSRARARLLAAEVAGATPLLVTTADVTVPEEARHRGRGAPVKALARDDLARLLAAFATRPRAHASRLHAAPSLQDRAEASGSQMRAHQAAVVRATLIQGCQRAAELLCDGLAGRSPAHADEGESFAAPTAEQASAPQVARQALAALETLAEAWEALFGSVATWDNALTITADATQLDEQREQAEHLLGVLKRASAAVGHEVPIDDRVHRVWHEAVVQELQLRCEALAARCEAIDPEQWRSFGAAHSQEAAQRSARAAAASRRAAIRAEQLAGELMARATGVAHLVPRTSSVDA